MKKIFCILVYSVFLTTINAQQNNTTIITGSIIGKGKPYTNKIALRWNINNAYLLQDLCIDGVVIDRLIINNQNKAEGTWQRITTKPIKALTINEFQKISSNKDSGKLIIAQSLYGKSEIAVSNFIEQISLQQQDAQNRHLVTALYATVDRENAFAAGLGFEDKINVDASKNYVYRICAEKQTEKSRIDTGFIFVAGRDIQNTNEQVYFATTENADSAIVLKWPSQYNKFSAYIIERSTDNKNFIQVSHGYFLPSIDTVNGIIAFTDKVDNFKNYYYRITGINAFGEHFTTNYKINGRGIDKTPPTPVLLKFKRDNNEVKFTWNKPKDKDVKAVYLMQGKNLNKYDSLLTPNSINPLQTNYNISLPQKFTSAYYRLAIIDTNNNMSFSNQVYVFIPSNTAPASPIAVTGFIDSTGKVHVSWSAKTDKELRGYKLMMANNENGPFTLASDIIEDTTYIFQNTLNTLTKNLFIQVVAVDGNFNHSLPSQTITIQRPLKNKPLTPVFSAYYVGTNGINLEWVHNSSENFNHFLVLRHQVSNNQWTTIATTTQTSFTDTSVIENTLYDYTLQAVSTENVYSDSAFFIRLAAGKKSTSNNLVFYVSKNETNHQYTLSWKLNYNKPVKFFVLYKNDGEGLMMYKSFSKDQLTFSEKNSDAKKVTYAIAATYSDNTTSEIIEGIEKL